MATIDSNGRSFNQDRGGDVDGEGGAREAEVHYRSIQLDLEAPLS
jgi:hypothetical protein